MEIALEAGAQDVANSGDGTVEVLTEVADVYKVKDAFEKVGLHPTQVGFSYVPKSTAPVGKEMAEKLLQLLDSIEDHDDVQRVHANFEIDDKILAELTAKQTP